jgi:tetratricopeptide (TPR) repeat protein/DNA-binding CsgD family transcriptional regulator
MENIDSISTSHLYDEHLQTINNIKFTNRELDVIACIFHTRGAGKIASLLNISTRTVEAHTANIMRKIDTNSREGIIDFLEKHSHTTPIKKLYRVLLLQSNFEKRLQEIYYFMKDQHNVFYIVGNSYDKGSFAFLDTFIKHLNICGINAIIYENDTHKFLQNTFATQEPTANTHIINFTSKNYVSTLAINETDINNLYTALWPHHRHYFPLLTYALFDVSPSNIPSALQNKNVVCIKGDGNYYFSFFSLLKSIIPSASLNEVILSFEKHHETALRQLDHEVLSNDSSPVKQNTSHIFSKKQISNIVLISSIFMGALYLSTYLMNYYRPNGVIKTDSKASRSIRSDLIVPSQGTFLSRPNLMAKIEESLKGKDGIQSVAIVGMGGAGKSTIARRYALTQNFTIVWEVNATNRETLMASFERLAYALCKSEEERKLLQGLQNIKDDLERGEKVLIFVKGALKSNSNWLLVYDNVEKFTSIRKYYPSDSTVWGNGKIIITTTNSNTKNNSLINNFINIGELSPQEKLHLFKKIMAQKDETLDKDQEAQLNYFLNEIPPFPLDVSIAAYYIKATNTPYKNYLERLKQDNKDFENIQIDVVKEASGYSKTRYNIITLSLQQLIESHKDFKDLLLLISLIDYRNIPSTLLASYKGDTVVDNFIYNLKQYSLITPELAESPELNFSLHKNTQEIILAYLVKLLPSTEIKSFMYSIGNALDSYIFEAVDNENFSKMKLLVPHCEAILKHNNLIIEPTKSIIGGALGCIYYYLRYNIRAKQLLETNLDNLYTYQGEHQDKIARLLVYLGNFYRYVGDFEKAKTLLTQSLTIYNKTHNDHRKARALGYLGAVYKDLGDYQTSKNLLTQSLDIYDKHNLNNIGHAWILAQLGNIYMILGNYEKSKLLLEQSLAIYKKKSEDYVGVSWVLGYLGVLYMYTGNLDQAQSLLEQSLTITRKYFSDDHIFIATRAASMGSLYALKGDYQKAKELLISSLKIYENNYGPNNIETARVYRMLGEAYMLEGDLDAAEDMINKSLLVFQQKKYPESYKSLISLADVYIGRAEQAASEGDPEQDAAYKSQARDYLNQSLGIIKKALEENSPHIITVNEKLNKLKTLNG